MLLAGPIVRRVEVRSVSVWIASSNAATLRLGLWQGNKSVGPGHDLVEDTPDFVSEDVATVRIGAGLHIGLVTLEIEDPAQLFPGQVYSYNVTVIDNDGTHDLKSWGLVADGPLNGKPHEPLGYGNNRLPSFVTPPVRIEDVRIYQGSCRKAHGQDPDALAFLDDEIKLQFETPTHRPHQLYLTGDQIYADEVPMSLLPHLSATGQVLMGGIEPLPLGVGGQVEVTQENIPAGFRQWFMENAAGFTSVSADSHVIALGEYCASYLFSISNVSWPDMGQRDPSTNIPPMLAEFNHAIDVVRMTVDGMRDLQLALFKDPKSDFEPSQRIIEFLYTLSKEQRDRLFQEFPDEVMALDRVRDPAFTPPAGVSFLVDEARVQISGQTKTEARATLEAFTTYVKAFRKAFRKKTNDSIKQALLTVNYYDSLPKVRRALANVVTYMIFDDHDVTDDWNINQEWRSRVYGSQTGRTIVRNAIIAYIMFQGWGNDPAAFDNGGDNAPLLQLCAALYAGGTTPDPAAVNALDAFLGLDNSVSSARWHYEVPGSTFLVRVLDTRTQRQFIGPRDPPNLIRSEVFDNQLPRELLQAGNQVVIVVSPVPILGLPLIDELFRPLASKFMGTLMLDIENWSADTAGFEALLARLATYKQVLILSGDVHYSSSATLDYWRKDIPEPSRFVEFTSSALKNIIPLDDLFEDPKFVFRSSFSQRLLRMNIPIERLGWPDPTTDPVQLSAQPTPPPLRARLRRTPVVIPTHGWPVGTGFNEPVEWSWRFKVLRDERPDEQRPEAVRPRGLDGPIDADNDAFETYRRIARRHVAHLKSATFSRQMILSTSIGRVSFRVEDDNSVTAIYDMLGVHPEDPVQRPAAYTRHEASLAPSAEAQPTLIGP